MRSLLFVPADGGSKLEKAMASGTDAVIIDLEDSITPERKTFARKATLEFLKQASATTQRPRLLVRINGLDTGMTDADLASISVPTVVIPGNDQTHASINGKIAAQRIPGAVLHQLPIEDQEIPLINYTEWAPLENEIAQTFLELMRKVDSQRPRGQAAAS